MKTISPNNISNNGISFNKTIIRQSLIGSILAVSLVSTIFAGPNQKSCYAPPNPDPLVGVWNGTVSVPGLNFTGPANFSFHAGGTLNGQAAQCIGVPIISSTGNLFTVDTGAWKKSSNYNYKIMYTDVAVAPTVIAGGTQGVLPTTPIGRTGVFTKATLSNDCKTITLTGTIGLYDESDFNLDTALEGPLDITVTLHRVDLK